MSDFLDAIIATQPMEYVHKVGVARFTFGQQMRALSYSEDFFDICHDQSRSACMVEAMPTFLNCLAVAEQPQPDGAWAAAVEGGSAPDVVCAVSTRGAERQLRL